MAMWKTVLLSGLFAVWFAESGTCLITLELRARGMYGILSEELLCASNVMALWQHYVPCDFALLYHTDLEV